MWNSGRHKNAENNVQEFFIVWLKIIPVSLKYGALDVFIWVTPDEKAISESRTNVVRNKSLRIPKMLKFGMTFT